MTTFKNIIKISQKIKDYVEKNHKLPGTITIDKVDYTYMQAGYLISKAINNPGKEIKNIKVKEAPAKTGETVILKLTEKEYKKLAKKLADFITEKNRLPNYILYNSKKIKQRVFIYSFAKIIVFYNTNKRLPSTCKFYTSETVAPTTNTTTKTTTSTTNTAKSNCSNPFTSSPHYTSEGSGYLGQISSKHCGPNMVHQMLRKFGVTKYSQSDIGRLAGTGSSGTDPDSLASVIAYISKKEGLKLTVQRKYLSDFGKTTDEQFAALAKLMCKSNIFIGTHIGYQDSGSAGGSGYSVFGHYECFDKIDTSKKQLRILNSLGNHCGSGYCGHLQWRSYSLEKTYINNKSGVKSIWVITKG